MPRRPTSMIHCQTCRPRSSKSGVSFDSLSPIFLSSLLDQDMFLASSIVLILSALTVLGTLISDLLLAWIDPRIKQAV